MFAKTTVLAGLIFALVVLPAVFFFWLVLPARILATVIREQIGPGQDWRYNVSCHGFDCASFFDELPPLKNVDCGYGKFISGGLGDCCLARFEDGTSLEVHVWWQVFRYKVPFKWKTRTSQLQCQNPSFDPSADPDTLDGREFIPCSEPRRDSGIQVQRKIASVSTAPRDGP